MNIIYRYLIKMAKLQKTTVLTGVFFIAVMVQGNPALATNLKKWNMDFFDNQGNQVGVGNFSYDLDKETLIDGSQYMGPSFTVRTALESFEASVNQNTFVLSDKIGQYLWFLPEQQGLRQLIGGTEFTGWNFESRPARVSAISFGINDNKTWFANGVEGTWRIYEISEPSTEIPEPSTMIGTIGTAITLGLGACFKKKRSRNS